MIYQEVNVSLKIYHKNLSRIQQNVGPIYIFNKLLHHTVNLSRAQQFVAPYRKYEKGILLKGQLKKIYGNENLI